MGLLDDLRVVDLADGIGELCGRVLADLGADVVRVEPPGGAASRRLPPFAADGTSLFFAYRNANKSVVELDLDTPAGRRAFDDLLAGADLLVEAFAPGTLAARHPELAPDRLVARHPTVVVTSITPFGQDGPYRDHAATELVMQALAGTLYRAGTADRPPCAAPGAFAGDVGGVTAALASLLAIRQARSTGRGQHVDVSCIEALAHLADWALPLWSVLRTDQQRAGAQLYPLFRCADGFMRLVLPMTARDCDALLAWLDAPELSDIVPVGPMLPLGERERVCATVARVFADRTRAELTSAGMAAGVKVTPVLEPGEVLTNEHAVSRGSGVPFAIPGGVQGCVPAGFFSVDGRRAGIRHPARSIDRVPEWPERVGMPGDPSAHATRFVASAPAAAPLAGVRVLDFGIGGVGVEAGRMLAESGADVIKVESAKRPDFQRMVLGGVMNPTFASSSRSKRGLGVNLATEDGRDLLRRLLPAVDVVVENSATGAMARLGLGYDDLRAVNPRIVMVSSQLMGDRGAWAHWKGYGPSARAAGGLTWLWTHPGRPEPGGVSTIHPDHFAGRLLALGAVAGLSARGRTGAGCHVDVAQFEAVMGLLGDLWLAESVVPGSVRPVGNTRAGCAPWGVYRCADDHGSESWVAICVRDDTDWQRLRAAIGEPSWAAGPELDSAAGRCAAREELDERVGEWTATRDARDVMTLLQTAGVPAGVLLHPRTLVDDPHFRARRFVRPIEQPGCGEVLLDGPAFRGADLGEPRIEPAPLPGQHTRELCRTLLGLGDDEIDRFVAAGALEE